MCVCVFVCVRACARACARACVSARACVVLTCAAFFLNVNISLDCDCKIELTLVFEAFHFSNMWPTHS